MTLPAGWTTRRPTLGDVPAILAVVHAADTFAIGHPDFDAEDVAASLTAPHFDPARDSWLAVDPEGDVVGWATVDNPTGVGREFVEVYVDLGRAATAAFADTADHEPLSYERWRARIGDLNAWDEWFVAEVDGVPVGALQSSDQALDQQQGWVKALSVLSAYRRRGVGAALLRRAFARYAEKGRQSAGLGVDLTNPTAPLSLYESVGLREILWTDMYELSVPAAGV